MVKIAKGVSKVLYFRKLGEAADGLRLVLQTEHSKSYSRDREATVTKDGSISGSGALEDEVSISALQAETDPTFDMLSDSIIEDYAVEMWEVDLAKPNETGDGFESEYRQGYITEWESTNSAEDDPEVSGTFVTSFKRQKGVATLPGNDTAFLGYIFHDLLVTDPADDGLAEPVPAP